MDKINLLEKVEELTLYTGTFGRKKCTCSCIGCTQESYGRRHKDYQGNLEQIKIIIEKLPNLKNAYILGNPDVSVDTEFCNKAAKEFIKAGKKVMFSTSGYNEIEVIKKLTEEIDSKNINYISYSVDTMDNEKLQYLKGSNKINLDEINEAIKYCLSEGVTVKIQPTIWEINQDDYKDIIEFYSKLGIEWFTFHAGSFESLQGRDIPLNHVKPRKWMEIVKEINRLAIRKNLKIKAPKIFLDDDEWKTYKQENKVYCQNGGRGLQIWMQEDGLKATFCPVLSEVMPEFTFDLEKEEPRILNNEKNNCMVCNKCLDNKVKNMSVKKEGREFLLNNKMVHNVCRYYSEKRRYG